MPRRGKEPSAVAATPAPDEPVVPYEEWAAGSGEMRISLAGFRAWLNVTGQVKQRSRAGWADLYGTYLAG